MTTDYVGEALGVFNGAATFITLVGASPPSARSPVRAAAGLEANDDRARAGSRSEAQPLPAPMTTTHWSIRRSWRGIRRSTSFEVDGSKHLLVDIGETGPWDGEQAANELEKLVEENRRLWGFLPFKRYRLLERLSPGRRRPRAQELDLAHRRSSPGGLPRPELSLACLRQP